MKLWAVLAFIGFALPVWGQTPLTEAERAYDSGDFVTALKLFQGLVEHSQGEQKAEALLGKGKTSFALLDYAKAEAAFEAVLQSGPSAPLQSLAEYWKGRVLLTQNHPNAALAQFAASVQTDPQSSEIPNALFWMADASTALGQYEAAGNLYNRLIHGYPYSYKVEAAKYRLAVLDMDARENKLLNVLRWANIEALNAADEYQRREKAYQKEILDLQKKLIDGAGGEAQAAILLLKKELAQAQAKIEDLEAQLKGKGHDTRETLDNLREKALSLKAFFLDWRLVHEKP